MIYLYGSSHISKPDVLRGIQLIAENDIICLEYDRARYDSKGLTVNPLALYQMCRMWFNGVKESPMKTWAKAGNSKGKPIYFIDQMKRKPSILKILRNPVKEFSYFVDERSLEMAKGICQIEKANPDKKILAMVGGGHVTQMEEILKEHGYNAEGEITEDALKVLVRYNMEVRKR